MPPIQIDLLGIAAVCGSIATIWGVVAKVISPIRKMLKEYDASLRQANDKLRQMDVIIDDHKREIERSKDDREKMLRAVKALLRYCLFSECLRATAKGHRSHGASKDLEPVYQSYDEMGLNGLGDKVYSDYLALPTEK